MSGEKKAAKIFAICGEKNSGKTTLIEAVLPLLTQRGIRTAVIKHDGHRFEADVPETDSRRFFDAGACGTAVYDSEKCMIIKRQAVDERMLFAAFPEADLILIEGLKHSSYPKLLLKAGEWRCPRETADMLESFLYER